ncbi:MAG: purine-nucleoside phosphorylase [Gammaproteobacteria bacterium]|nr:purine-nucleoside phosphorylase [Gammaproteobacteria bacterium]
MPAKHIDAERGDFAATVLMPGDPLRAQYIADTYLGRCAAGQRSPQHVGIHRPVPRPALSVMAHGMGIPSAQIYCHELITEFDVRRIIRVGSCGTAHPSVKLRDIVIAMGASTDSGVNRTRFGGHDLAALASFRMLRNAVGIAEERKLRFHVGNVFSADFFYTPVPGMFDLMEKHNIIGIEMEAAGIYALATELGAEALAICTVSDNVRGGAELTHAERQSSFDDMIRLALDTALMDS